MKTDISSLYIHFPFCSHLCNYCDFYKKKLESNDQVQTFEQKLSEQWFGLQKLNKKNAQQLSTLKTIYIGGGTPSLWGSRGVEFIQNHILNNVNVDENLEMTLEVDPDAWSEKELLAWIDLGVNRVSVGMQAFDDNVLKDLDRQHRSTEIKKLLSFLASKKINYSVDFLIGAPKLTTRDVLQEIDMVLPYRPSHFSVYILKTRKNYPHNDFLPGDEVAKEYLDVVDKLKSAGFYQYEVSNFSKPGFESKHNVKYWQFENVAAIGPNSTGFMNLGEEFFRYQWKSVGQGYSHEVITGESMLIEKLFLSLRTVDGLRPLEILTDNFDEQLWAKLYNSWEKSGYLAKESTLEHLVLGPNGFLLSDSILEDILKTF